MFDVIVIGGSFAGLTAALQLGRASRSVLVVDAGSPRNRTSAGAHGVAGWDGVAPGEILARFRDDLGRYPTLQSRNGEVIRVEGSRDSFVVCLADGAAIAARRIILAHGVQDILPDVPGLGDGWGKRVLHCPYCHGYEVRGEPLAVLAVHPLSAHQALMLRADWSTSITFFTGGMDGFDFDALERAGVRVDARGLKAAQPDDHGISVVLSDGSSQRYAAMFVGPRTSLAGSPAEQLGCATAEGPMGNFVRVGPMAQTTIPGVFAAGDLARPAPNINFALADGAQAGIASHASLLSSDLVPQLEIAS